MTRMTRCSCLAVAGFTLGCTGESPNGPAGSGPGFPMPNFSLIIGTTSTVNDGPGDQSDPHISGALVSYSSNADGTNRIRYHDLATGTDAVVPNSGEADLLSGISGSKIVFTHVPTAAIYLYDVAAGGSPVAVDPVDPSLSSKRRHSAIGGSTIAWQDFGLNAEFLRPEIVVHELGGSTTRLTTDELLDRTPAVSPDGNVVVWAKCQTTGTGCDIWKAERSAGVWTASAITGSEGEDARPATDGQIVVYASIRSGETDVFWKPVAGGAEQQLSLSGEQVNPNVSGGVIAFDSRDAAGSSDVLAFEIASSTLHTITSTSANERLNDVWVSADGIGHIVYASDATGDFNVYAVSLQLSVGADEQLSNLIAMIESMNLHAGLANSLTMKLDVAQAKLTADNVTAACNMLQAFINEVNAQRGGKLTSSQADQLLAAAQQLRATLGCS
jgi:Tol biopolymer transport system component